MRYRKEIDNVRAHINTLRAVIGVLVLVLAGTLYGWSQAPDELRIHIPPELRTGAVLDAGEVPEPAVYTFAYYIFQQLHRWPEDGTTDYPNRIFDLQAFFTPRWRQSLQEDLDVRGRRGELTNRTRAVREVPGTRYEAKRVRALGDDTWVVELDVQIQEWVHGNVVKDTVVRYPLRVVRLDIDPESNPWGLALDGYQEPPQRIDTGEEE